jgi:hypothetical protein
MALNGTSGTTLDQFTEKLKEARAASAYGIDTRELRHNAFLDFMLQSSMPRDFGLALVKRIAEKAAHCRKEDTDWRALAQADILRIEPYCNLSAGKGRPDEKIIVHTSNQGRFAVIIEMKVKAPKGSNQLEDYVRHERADASTRVLGLLLRIPGRDAPDDRTFPVLTGLTYGDCIVQAKATTKDQIEANRAWLLNDYLKTLEFLDQADEVILKYCKDLHEIAARDQSKLPGSPEPLRSWCRENERWIYERAMREVAKKVPNALRGWSGGAYSSKDGSAVDLELKSELGEHLLFFGPKQGECGAYLYVRWKLGLGFEVRAIVQGYDGPRPAKEPSRPFLDELSEKGRARLKELWSRHPDLHPEYPPDRRDDVYSRCLGRLPDRTYDVADIAERFRADTERIQDDLVAIVGSLRSTLPTPV